MHNSPYTEEEMLFIQMHCSEMTATELVELLNTTFNDNRTKKGIQYFMQSRGLKCLAPKNTWADGFTAEQKDFLKQCGATMSRKALTELFNKYFHTDVCLSTIKGFCNRNKIPSPNGNGRFTTETSPRWQKGLSAEEFKSHYSEESYQKLLNPMLQSNIKYHVGDEVIRHGVPYIVVNDDFGVGYDHRLERKSIYVWKQHHGEVPPHHIIINLDNDKMNCDISNLRCIPTKYRAFLRHNDWWNAPVEIKEVALKWCELHYALRG